MELNGALKEAVLSGCSTLNSEWEGFSIQPVFDLDPEVGEMTLVERDFDEAILNLVSNAYFAMHEKSRASEGYEPALFISTRRIDDTVEIRVRDNGPGIPDDIVGRIFNPFFSTRDGAVGAGLGLPLAADVARRYGGDLSVDTVHGEYAEFLMTLQLTGEDAVQPADQGSLVQEPA